MKRGGTGLVIWNLNAIIVSNSLFTMLHLNGYIPADVGSVKEKLNSSSTKESLNLPLKPSKNKEKWEVAYASALEDPNDINKWNEVFDLLDQKWEQVGNSDKSAPVIKNVVQSSYSKLLLRFPYLTEHWKRYLIVQYKMNGLEQSLETLRQGTKSNPQSVSLWVDFFGALLAVYETKAESEKTAFLDEIRDQFQDVAQVIGLNYNSDLFWNKYIEFELKFASETPSLALLELYKHLITIPLYQYAQYYNQFAEISKTYTVNQVIGDEIVLQQFLAQFSKTLVDELSMLEQHQIIDSYNYSIFSETQKKVTEKWEYESVLTHQEFSLLELEEIEKQSQEWVKYADYEIGCLQNAQQEKRNDHIKMITSIFERALVPNCFNESLWLKYVSFLRENILDKTEMFKSTKAVFDRAIFGFVPLEKSNIRTEYVKFLMLMDEFDLCNEFLLDCIRLFSGVTGNRVYVKSPYVNDISQLINFWKEHVNPKKLLTALEGFISAHFERIDRYRKETETASTTEEEGDKYELKPSYLTAFSRFLNGDGICVVATQYLRLLGDEDKIRTFYNKYHREEVFSRSVQFWKFFVEFEGYQQHNIVNLRTVVSHIKQKTALPKQAVDAFIDIYYEVTCANMAEAISLRSQDDFLDILVTHGIEKSDDLEINTSARKRLAWNNYMLQDLVDQRGKGIHFGTKEEELMNMRLRHLDHPGIFVDAVPEFTNSMFGGEWVSLLDDNVRVPPLPTVKNVEKANASIKYPDE